MPATLYLNPASMDEMLLSPNGMVGRFLDERATIVQTAARAQIKARKYNTAGGARLEEGIVKRISVSSNGQSRLVGAWTVPYALWVHEGNAPQGTLIKPNPEFGPDGHRRMLRFNIGGQTLFRPWVKASTPNRYLFDNLHLAVP